MKEFTTRVTTIRDYKVSESELRMIADDIELAINDYIECNWHDISTAAEVPLEIRQKFLLHVIKEMFDPNSDFKWMD